MSIRLSEQHGVNPSVAVCYYCGEDTGELILAGRLPEDQEAPRRAVWSKKPCAQCERYMQQGVILIEVLDGEEGDNPRRTGGYAVIKDEGIRKALDTATAETVITKRVAFVPEAAWGALGLPHGKDAIHSKEKV